MAQHLVVEADLRSISPYSQSKAIQSTINTGEAKDSFEERTWRERMHTDEDGIVFIPTMAIKNCLSNVAKFLAETVPGKGKATYTKHFEAGTMVLDPISLGIKAADVFGERLFVPSDGVRGGGKRVWKTFPLIPKWTGTVQIHLTDPILIDKPNKVHEYLDHAGSFVGLGRFRPRNNGFYGRFKVADFRVLKGV